jgi:hypothetical protein
VAYYIPVEAPRHADPAELQLVYHVPSRAPYLRRGSKKYGEKAWDAGLVRQGKTVDHSGTGSNTHKQLRLCQDNEAPDP